jgi:soluble lytic murein transglycosylase-like protein
MGGPRRVTLIVAVLVAATSWLVLGAAPAGASTLGDQLRASQRQLHRAESRLAGAEAAYATALAARRNRGTGLLVLEIRVAHRAVAVWQRVVDGLEKRRDEAATTESLERAGDWKALIRRASRKYAVSAEGLYRLMIMESGGRATAVGAGRYYGLYQYSLGTWRAQWNPWRAENVFDGSAQIEATAYAVKKGMGGSLWGNTYPRAF